MSDLLEFLKSLGLKYKENPSADDLKLFLEKFIEDKKFTLEYLKEYGATAKVALSELYGALGKLIESEKANTAQVQATIRKALDHLKDIDSNRDLLPEQVAAYREDVFRIIAEARAEAAEARQFNKEVFQVAGGIAGGIAVTAIGSCVWIVMKSPQLLVKGGQMVSKAVEIAKSVWQARRLA